MMRQLDDTSRRLKRLRDRQRGKGDTLIVLSSIADIASGCKFRLVSSRTAVPAASTDLVGSWVTASGLRTEWFKALDISHIPLPS